MPRESGNPTFEGIPATQLESAKQSGVLKNFSAARRIAVAFTIIAVMPLTLAGKPGPAMANLV
jgi:hypothetical protein